MNKVLDILMNIDRRVIFLCIALSVIIPLLIPVYFPEKPTKIVQAVFDAIDELPDGSRVLVSFDYDPPSEPELQPMADALMRHLCQKNHRIYIMALWPMGQSMSVSTIESVIKKDFPNYKSGRDYVNLGFKSGAQGVINVVLTNFRGLYFTDVEGRSLNDLEIMKGVQNLQQMDLIINISAGTPGLKEWIQFAGDKANIPIVGGSTAVQAPLLYPYYPRQLVGLMGGLKGAAEFEAALGDAYPRFSDNSYKRAIRNMSPQAIAHLVIVAFILLGNITYFVERRRQARGGSDNG
ncbi:MAG: hypothetical protein P9M14_05470 [Candidatus Alcyoniella australis]|nr:hypothetical protein [Candidatus Alcyoniella australis]